MNRQWCSSCARFLVEAEFWQGQRWCKSCQRAWRIGYREIEREADRKAARWRERRRVERLNSSGPPATSAGLESA